MAEKQKLYKLVITSNNPEIETLAFEDRSSKPDTQWVSYVSLATNSSKGGRESGYLGRVRRSELLMVTANEWDNKIQYEECHLRFQVWCYEKDLEAGKEALRAKQTSHYQMLRQGFFNLRANMQKNHNLP